MYDKIRKNQMEFESTMYTFKDAYHNQVFLSFEKIHSRKLHVMFGSYAGMKINGC